MPTRKSQKPPTELQKAILNFMVVFYENYHRMPTIREIGAAVKRNSTSVINYNLKKLADAGKLERTGGGWRPYALPQKHRLDPIQLLSDMHRRVAAGQDAPAVVLDALLSILTPLDRDVFRIILDHPGTTSQVICEAIPSVNFSSIFAALRHLAELNLIVRHERTETQGFTYSPAGMEVEAA